MFGDVKDAAERAIESGVDVETPDAEGYVHLPELVREGRVSQRWSTRLCAACCA